MTDPASSPANGQSVARDSKLESMGRDASDSAIQNPLTTALPTVRVSQRTQNAKKLGRNEATDNGYKAKSKVGAWVLEISN